MLSMNKKVWLLNSKKTDGRYNKGVIVGIDKIYEGLGYMTERQYQQDFVVYKYKVAYVDVYTNKACNEWVHHSYVSTIDPTKET